MANYTVICVYQISLDPNHNSEAAIKEKCQSLADLDQQIEAKEGELKKIYQETQEVAGESVRNPVARSWRRAKLSKWKRVNK